MLLHVWRKMKSRIILVSAQMTIISINEIWPNSCVSLLINGSPACGCGFPNQAPQHLLWHWSNVENKPESSRTYPLPWSTRRAGFALTFAKKKKLIFGSLKASLHDALFSYVLNHYDYYRYLMKNETFHWNVHPLLFNVHCFSLAIGYFKDTIPMRQS